MIPAASGGNRPCKPYGRGGNPNVTYHTAI